MKVAQKRRWKILLVAGATMALVAGMASTVPSVYAGGMIKADDDKFISIGMGTRMSFNAVEDGSASGTQYSNNFNIDNARIYINGGIHKYVKFAFNTECFNCPRTQNNTSGGGDSGFGSNSNIGILDAIGQFEITETVNFWVGRTLVPTERGELNGPFYHSVFDGFRTPFNSADYSTGFGKNGAGLYGRDNGAVFFGKIHPGGTHLQYIASVFQGLRSGGSGCNVTPNQVADNAFLGGPPIVTYTGACGPNQRDNLLYAGRLTWNLLNDESNPGYYTSGTYYGTAGDILALAVGGAYQNAGSGTAINPHSMSNLVTDVLFEKVLPDKGVVTVNAEFKRYWAQNLAAFTDASSTGTGAFNMFAGTSWTMYALYLFPQEIGIGRFQPYGRYTGMNAQFAGAMEEWELGSNYVISGHNARFSAYWRNSNTLGPAGGGNWSTPAGQRNDSFVLALQLQY
jgi:hypothetical protein